MKLAVFPFMDKNRYGELLYGALSGHGIEAVPEAKLDPRWLWRHRGEVTFLHFHWDRYFYDSTVSGPRLRECLSWLKLVYFALLLMLGRALGYRIIWTVHEVVPHEARNPRRDVLAGRLLARLSHALICHDDATAHRAEAVLGIPSERFAVIPHGSYLGVYPEGRPRCAVRREFGYDDSVFVLLAFGNLRSYKRLDLLLDAFLSVPSPDVRLLITGQFEWRFRDVEWEQRTVSQLRLAAAHDPRIRYRIERVPDEQVAELHGAADAAVFARTDGWTSGSLILALSQGVPVLAPRLPAYAELLGPEDAGWLYEPGSVPSLADTISRAARERAQVPAKVTEARRRAQQLAWDEIATATASVMLSSLPGGRP